MLVTLLLCSVNVYRYCAVISHLTVNVLLAGLYSPSEQCAVYQHVYPLRLVQRRPCITV